MQRVAIFGATSAIAESTARLYAARGARLFLAGRRSERLAQIAADLKVRGAAECATGEIDFDDIAAHAALIDQAVAALGGIDVALIAYGTLPDQAACEASSEAMLGAFHTNGTSIIALMGELGRRLEAPATLAVISSVAGDRGRASNGVYGSAKAAVSAAASALRQSLGKRGVQVLTIKPGLVDSPMTASLPKGPIWAQPEQVARGIVSAIERRRDVVYLPGFWRLIMLIIRSIPEFVFKRLSF